MQEGFGQLSCRGRASTVDTLVYCPEPPSGWGFVPRGVLVADGSELKPSPHQ